VPKCPMDSSALVPKCLGAEVSRCRSVRKAEQQQFARRGRICLQRLLDQRAYLMVFISA